MKLPTAESLLTEPSLIVMGTLLAAQILITPCIARAQSKPSADSRDQEIELLKAEVKQLEQRVDTLEGLKQTVKVIDSKLDAQQQTAHQRELTMPIVKAGVDGFSLSSPDQAYNIELNGFIQGDGRFFTSGDDKNGGSTFFLNRVRPIITGAIAKYYDFNITPDFGQGRVVLQDAYVNMTYFDFANMRAGKYKAPLDLERLQNDRDLAFSERSEIQNLVPNRDYGVDLHGRLLGGRLFYDAALMNGVPNNTASVDHDINDGKDFVGRIFANPFDLSEKPWLKNLGLGFAGSYGNERGSTISTYSTYGMSPWFSYNTGVTASGLRARIEPQLYYYWRGFGLMAEYAQDRHSLNLNTTIHGKLVNRTDTFTDTGYFAQASYILTGENAAYGWIKPERPFDPRNGSWGGFELAARISNVATETRQFQLDFANPSVAAKTATEWALGLNWYLNNNVKWQFDYANTFFDGGAGTTAAPRDRPNESVFESQLQIAF